MSERRRIFVDVEPRLLGDSLVALLEFVGVDDVVTAPSNGGGLGMRRFDAAVVTAAPEWLDTEVLIEVPGDDAARPPIGDALRCATPEQLLELLDRHCPAEVVRAELLRSDGPARTGGSL